MANRLKKEKSPYLLQHGDNPVDWYPWGEEAFEKAIREEKPVFLSIGYSTCHWCHVMAHESFEDEEVAQMLNKNYICIKVDREERPDIDAVYMSACQAMTGSGGWPLTILMTPEQKPFFAGTYFPKRSRYGRPGLFDILKKTEELWEADREALFYTGEMIQSALCKEQNLNFTKAEPDRDILHKAFELFQRSFDSRWGGFGNAPKFPSPHNLLFLIRYAAMETTEKEESASALFMAEKTLHAMARGGMHDQIGGGFSRYSTDDKWLVPHFEKMLYDNALLILAYTDAYLMTKKEEYAETARRTADYVLRELTDEAGGFYCGQDADSDGVEGKYYVFTPEEVISVLGREKGLSFCERYGITKGGNFEGKSIPNMTHQDEILRYEEEERKLYQYRLKRTRLPKDDKILLSWNAWMMIALVKAGTILGEEKYCKAARRAGSFIKEKMTDEKNRLYLRFREGEAAHFGQLEDYGVYALALLHLYEMDFRIEYLEEAIFRAEQMLFYFEDREHGGFYKTASDAEKLIVRPKEVYDGAIPSGNSVAAMVLQKLARLTGETKWQEACDRQMQYLTGEIKEYPAGYSFSLLAMTDALDSHRELVCAVKDQAPKEIKEYPGNHLSYGLSILVKTRDNAKRLAKCAPFTAEYPLPKEGTVYYLCKNGVCSVPVKKWPL